MPTYNTNIEPFSDDPMVKSIAYGLNGYGSNSTNTSFDLSLYLSHMSSQMWFTSLYSNIDALNNH